MAFHFFKVEFFNRLKPSMTTFYMVWFGQLVSMTGSGMTRLRPPPTLGGFHLDHAELPTRRLF